MKKLLALMVAMLMVLGLASFAAAEVALSGDARVRGTSQGNFNMDSDTDEDNRFYDHRIRLKINGTNDDGAGVKVRVRLMNSNLDEADMAPGNEAVTYGGDDYAYMFVPVAENWVLSGGWMPADWGHRLWSWGASHQRVKVEGDLDGTIVGFFTQKDDDTLGEVVGDDNLKDKTSNSVWVVGKAGEFTVGATIKMTKDERVATTTNIDADLPVVNQLNCLLADGDWDGAACTVSTPGTDGDSGTEIDVFFTGKVGDITLTGELVQMGGDLNESSEGDSQSALYLGAAMDIDGMNVHGAFAMTKNGYVATGYFTPTLLVGTSQPTAAGNLGELGDTMALVLGVDTKISDEMGVGATVLYATLDSYPDDGTSGSLTEVDVKMSYALGEKTSFSAGVGYGIPDWDNLDLDPITAIGWSLNTSF